MKESAAVEYLVTWKMRANGGGHEDIRKTLAGFAEWQPPADRELQQVVTGWMTRAATP